MQRKAVSPILVIWTSFSVATIRNTSYKYIVIDFSIQEEKYMKLSGKPEKEVENIKAKEKVKDITQDTIGDSGKILSDEDLDNASGGASFEPRPNRRT